MSGTEDEREWSEENPISTKLPSFENLKPRLRGIIRSSAIRTLIGYLVVNRCQRFVAFLASLSGLTARAKGGLEMTQANQIKKCDDFKLVIVFRIEGKNSRAIVLRFVGIVAALIAICVKVAIMFMGRVSDGVMAYFKQGLFLFSV